MPKPQWDKKTISTYITQQQKEVWEKGKVCVWLDVPKELINKAKKPGEKNKNKTNSNPGLNELIQSNCSIASGHKKYY